MAELHRLNNPLVQNDSSARSQLSLSLNAKSFSGNLVCVFEDTLSPENIQKVLAAEGVQTVADMRRVPFFSGEPHRHKTINNILSKFNVPVFHVGAAYFSSVDQDLPDSVKRVQLFKQIEKFEKIRSEISERLELGACLIIVDHGAETMRAAKITIDVIRSNFENIQIKVNNAWASIKHESSRFSP